MTYQVRLICIFNRQQKLMIVTLKVLFSVTISIPKIQFEPLLNRKVLQKWQRTRKQSIVDCIDVLAFQDPIITFQLNVQTDHQRIIFFL